MLQLSDVVPESRTHCVPVALGSRPGGGAEFSHVDSRDFHTVINEQHIEEDAAVWGFIMWVIWRPLNHWASRPEAKWLSDSL